MRANNGLGTAVMAAAGGQWQEGCNLDLIKVLILSTLRSSERARKRRGSEAMEARAKLRRETEDGDQGKIESCRLESGCAAGGVPWCGALVLSWCGCGCGLLFAGLMSTGGLVADVWCTWVAG